MTSPLLYYYDFFKQYSIKRHDIRYIDHQSIAPTDVVIFGGGGLFDYAEYINRSINKVLDTGAAVIGWACGLNTHNDFKNAFQTKIDFERFALVTLRDYQNNYGVPYLPDITCKMEGLRKPYTIRRKFGIAQHKDFPIQGFEFEKIKNDRSIDEILQFIGESEVILSNSFHMIYWSILMGKKTICVDPFSTKFFNYKYKPEYVLDNKSDLWKAVESARNYQVLDECRQENDLFFERVKQIVESRLTPVPNLGDFEYFERVKVEALLRELEGDVRFGVGYNFNPELFFDFGDGFSEKNKMVAVNNVYGDPTHVVRYDISLLQGVKRFRFDPINRGCEVKILSAKDSKGEVRLLPQAAVCVEGKDRFLSTDPQYLIEAACEDFLEITFELRALSGFEMEQNINAYVHFCGTRFAAQDALLTQQQEQIEQLNNSCMNQKLHLKEKEEMIQSQMETLSHQKEMCEQLEFRRAELEAQNADYQQRLNVLLNSKSWRITAPLRTVMNFVRKIKGVKYDFNK